MGASNTAIYIYLVNKDSHMTKEVEKIKCNYCESSYKVLYDYEETQGQPRFCSFCGEECFDEDGVDLEDEDNE
jgi:hypothetical protein